MRRDERCSSLAPDTGRRCVVHTDCSTSKTLLTDAEAGHALTVAPAVVREAWSISQAQVEDVLAFA